MSPAPLRIGLLSAGGTARLDAPASDVSLDLLAREDLGPATQPDDLAAIYLLFLLEWMARAATSLRPFAYAVLGAVEDRTRLRDGLRRLLDLDVDLIVFWTFSPVLLPGEAAFDDLLQEAAARDIALVFPAAGSLGCTDLASIPVGALVAVAPFLDAVAAPPGWTGTPPLVASWADWPTARAALLGGGMQPPIPDTVPADGHAIAVWVVTLYLAILRGLAPARENLATLIDQLGNLAIPIVARPVDAIPSLGFIEPRQLDVASIQVDRRDG